MMKPFILKAILVFTLFCFACIINAQNISSRTELIKAPKPYKILTQGKQITIQSKQEIKSLMVWTSGGHRIVEAKKVMNTSYTFNVPSKEKLVFMMTELSDGKKYTEKIGIKQ